MRQSVPVTRCHAVKKIQGGRCNHVATIVVDGVPFCGIHDPEKNKQRSEARRITREKSNASLILQQEREIKIRRLAKELLREVVNNNDSRYQEFINRYKQIRGEEK